MLIDREMGRTLSLIWFGGMTRRETEKREERMRWVTEGEAKEDEFMTAACDALTCLRTSAWMALGLLVPCFWGVVGIVYRVLGWVVRLMDACMVLVGE